MFSWWSSSDRVSEENKNTEGGKTGEKKVVESSTNDREKVAGSDASETAKDLAKNLGSFLYNVANVATKTAVKVKDTVKETVEGKDLLAGFNKEQEKFLNEKHSKRKETGVPPWVGYNEEETMKSQILALSSDERNFLRDPPSGVQFVYDYDSMFPVALATLEEDPELKKMRFNLVPKKVKETTFWRNYFYRVSLIKQSSQLTSLASSSGSTGSSTKIQKTIEEGSIQSPESSSEKNVQELQEKTATDTINEDLGEMSLSLSPTQEEFISDAYEGAHELSKEDLKQIGVERSSKKPQNKTAKSAAASAASTPASISASGQKETAVNSTTVKDGQVSVDDIPDWERELQEELQDYDIVNEDDKDDGTWEKEIEDMLEAEGS